MRINGNCFAFIFIFFTIGCGDESADPHTPQRTVIHSIDLSGYDCISAEEMATGYSDHWLHDEPTDPLATSLLQTLATLEHGAADYSDVDELWVPFPELTQEELEKGTFTFKKFDFSVRDAQAPGYTVSRIKGSDAIPDIRVVSGGEISLGNPGYVRILVYKVALCENTSTETCPTGIGTSDYAGHWGNSCNMNDDRPYPEAPGTEEGIAHALHPIWGSVEFAIYE